MTCTRFPGGIIIWYPSYRLPLADGTRIYMHWHTYCGPTFYRDRNESRTIDEWYDNPLICAAFDWFWNRGKRA